VSGHSMAQPSPDDCSGLGTALHACHRRPMNGSRCNSCPRGAEEQEEGVGLTDCFQARLAGMGVKRCREVVLLRGSHAVTLSFQGCLGLPGSAWRVGHIDQHIQGDTARSLRGW